MRLRLLLTLLVLAGAAGAQESTAIVPVVGTTFGPGVIWKTDVEIINDTGTPATVVIELSTSPDGLAIFFDLGPGEARVFTDIIGQVFGLPFALSPLRVTSNTRRALTVHATVYGIHDGEVTKPQPITVYTGQSWYPLRALDGLSFTDEYRTNIGLVNFGDTPAEFLLALQRVPGRNLAVSYMTVAPSTLAHMSIQSLFPMISKGDDFTVVIETVAPDTYVYASVIDNSHAGRFVAPRPATR
jgi:hypothetical protein